MLSFESMDLNIVVKKTGRFHLFSKHLAQFICFILVNRTSKDCHSFCKLLQVNN